MNFKGSLLAVVVTWNSAKYITSCLESLCSVATGIVIIDNASVDNTVEIVREKFPSAHVITNDTNKYLSHALNQGINFKDSQYYFILNPDIELNSKTVNHLVHFLQNHTNVGIVGPRLVYPDGTFQHSCRTFPTLHTVIARGITFNKHRSSISGFMQQHLMINYDHVIPREVDWILGAAMMIRRECINEIGGFDEKYPIYYGDVDLCWRANKHGWKVVYNPEAIAIHHYQRSSARGGIFNPLKWSHARSALRFLIRKNFS